MHTRL